MVGLLLFGFCLVRFVWWVGILFVWLGFFVGFFLFFLGGEELPNTEKLNIFCIKNFLFCFMLCYSGLCN